MANTGMDKIRNFGIFAHIDAGKTTITERVLYYTGRTHRIGEVHDGAAVMDWMKQEQERGITITAATTRVEWKGYDLHLIDTPGHVDFTVEVERSLRVLDGVMLVIDAVAGVQPQTETIWRQSSGYRVPVVSFINKMDRIGADFHSAVESLEAKLGARPLYLVEALGAESDFKGVVDLLTGEALIWKDDTLGAEVERRPVEGEEAALLGAGREKMLETLADFDDGVAEAYLEGRMPELAELKRIIRRLTIKGEIVPVLCGAALKNKGVQMVLDAVIDYLPSPNEAPPVEGVHPDTGEVEKRKPNPKEPFSALAFKIQQDQGRKLTYVRVYSGVFKGGRVYNSTRQRVEKPAAILAVHADKKERVDEATAGDIIAFTGLKWTATGDTLCDQNHQLLLETIIFAEPVISMAVEPKMTQDEDKMIEVMERIQEEDPTFRVENNDETGQTIISGMGELHLEVVLTRVETEFNVGVHVGKPQVVYKETIQSPAGASGEFDRVLGEKKHRAVAEVKLRPGEREAGNRVQIAPSIGEKWPQFADIVTSGVEEALACGPLGFMVEDTNIEVVSVDGDENTISEMAVKVALAQAIRAAAQKAGAVKLEPVMDVAITVPEENMGEVIGDLNSRRGVVQGVESLKGAAEIKAHVTLRGMFGYSTDLRSLTQGRGTFTMKFHRYDAG